MLLCSCGFLNPAQEFPKINQAQRPSKKCEIVGSNSSLAEVLANFLARFPLYITVLCNTVSWRYDLYYKPKTLKRCLYRSILHIHLKLNLVTSQHRLYPTLTNLQNGSYQAWIDLTWIFSVKTSRVHMPVACLNKSWHGGVSTWMT